MAQFFSGDLKVGIDTYAERANIRVPDGTEDAASFNTKVYAKVLWKLDWHLLPLVSLFYFLSFMDRVNIGNARIAGMEKDLNLIGLRFNVASAMFFVTYIIGQAPSNVILKLVRPSRWIPTIMVTWGMVMTLMCLVKTYPQLVIVRALLGLAEAGLLPGVIFYLSMWYPRAQRAKRIAVFVSSSTVAGAFGGVLAFAIEKMEGIGGLHGWQWIFCLEGVATVLAAVTASFVMHDYPETASFLTEAERRCIVEVMRIDSEGLATHYDFQFILQAFKDYKTYLQSGMCLGFAVPAYAIALFTPTIIKELGFSAAKAQLLSVPPFVAGCMATILVGIVSDRHRLRGPYVIGVALVGLVGCLVLYTQAKPGVALFGIILTAMGVISGVPIVFAWASSNAGGEVKRSVAIAIVSAIANFAGICASFIFFDPPRFHVGLGVCMGLLGCTILAGLFTMWDYDRINKQKEKWCSEQGITDKQKDQFQETGDASPLFRYTL